MYQWRAYSHGMEWLVWLVYTFYRCFITIIWYICTISGWRKLCESLIWSYVPWTWFCVMYINCTSIKYIIIVKYFMLLYECIVHCYRILNGGTWWGTNRSRHAEWVFIMNFIKFFTINCNKLDVSTNPQQASSVLYSPTPNQNQLHNYL